MVWIQIRTDIFSVLTLVQTVYKGYQQTTKKVPASKERVNKGLLLEHSSHKTSKITILNWLILSFIPFSKSTDISGHTEFTLNP